MKIIGIRIADREKEAGDVQSILTKYGCIIKTRLGLHEAEKTCTSQGLILLELTGDTGEQSKLEEELQKVDGVSVKSMTF